MAINSVTHLIQVMIVPVVMVTACALLINGMLHQYASINDRLRSMARERLDFWRLGETDLTTTSLAQDAFTRERLEQLDTQLPQLLRRHHLVHQALLPLYIAILGFIACMFLVVFAALLNFGLLATIALLLFLASTGVLLAGLIPVVREIHGSQQAICYEVQRVLSLGK